MEIAEKILRTAVNWFGKVAQKEKAIEELTELSIALQHHKHDKCNDAEVVTEIADVIIMCEQLKFIYGVEEVEKQIEFKMNRLSKLIHFKDM